MDSSLPSRIPEKIQEQMWTGDLLLFHHKPKCNGIVNTLLSFFNWTIDELTDSKYSHCAMVIRDPNFTSPPKYGLYVLESSYEEFPDAEDGEHKVGVELEDFDQMTANWSGDIYWRKLNCARDAQFYARLAQAHSVVHNRPYDVIFTDWLKAECNTTLGGHNQRTKTFWCSALCSYIYTKLGFLPSDTPWTIISPKSLGTESGDQRQLEFIGCDLEPEIKITE